MRDICSFQVPPNLLGLHKICTPYSVVGLRGSGDETTSYFSLTNRRPIVSQSMLLISMIRNTVSDRSVIITYDLFTAAGVSLSFLLIRNTVSERCVIAIYYSVSWSFPAIFLNQEPASARIQQSSTKSVKMGFG